MELLQYASCWTLTYAITCSSICKLGRSITGRNFAKWYCKSLSSSQSLARSLQKNLGVLLQHTHIFAIFCMLLQYSQPNDSMCCPGPAFSAAAPKFFIFSGKHWEQCPEHHPIYSKFMLEPSVYIILHVWLWTKCNNCKNVQLLQTLGIFAKLMWNFEIALNMQIM